MSCARLRVISMARPRRPRQTARAFERAQHDALLGRRRAGLGAPPRRGFCRHFSARDIRRAPSTNTAHAASPLTSGERAFRCPADAAGTSSSCYSLRRYSSTLARMLSARVAISRRRHQHYFISHNTEAPAPLLARARPFQGQHCALSRDTTRAHDDAPAPPSGDDFACAPCHGPGRARKSAATTIPRRQGELLEEPRVTHARSTGRNGRQEGHTRKGFIGCRPH